MNLEFQIVRGRGQAQRECIVLKCRKNENLGWYQLFFSERSGDGNFLSLASFAFWLPQMLVRANDMVYVFTGSGINKTEWGPTHNSPRQHYIYMNLDEPFLRDRSIAVIIARMETWKAY